MKIPPLLLLFFCLFCVVPGSAQEKITVGIIPAKDRQYSFSSTEETEITNSVTNAFVKSKRFTIVDRAHMDALNNEKYLQKSEDYINGTTVQQGKSLGAQYLISIASSDYVNDGAVCKFKLQLTVIDVTTGQVAGSESIDVKGGGHGRKIAGAVGGAVVGHFVGIGAGFGALAGGAASSGSREKALQKALHEIAAEIDDFVSVHFPLYFSIVEIEEKDEAGTAKKILISGGNNFGLKKGDRLKVVEISEVDVDGKKISRKKDVCTLRVAKVEDGNFSSCTVTTQQNTIAALLSDKKKLKVTTIID